MPPCQLPYLYQVLHFHKISRCAFLSSVSGYASILTRLQRVALVHLFLTYVGQNLRLWRETRQTTRQFNDHVGRYRLSSDDSSRQKEMVAKFSIWNSPFVFNQIRPLISALRTGDSCRRPPPPPPLVISSLMTSRIYLTYISPPNIERPVLPRARKISLLSLDAFFESLVVDAHAPRSHGEQTELHHVTCPSRVHFHSQS